METSNKLLKLPMANCFLFLLSLDKKKSPNRNIKIITNYHRLCWQYFETFAPLILIGCYEIHAKNKLYDISNLKLSVLSSVKHLDLRFFIFRALFCVSLVLKVISFDRVAVLTCSVAIFCENDTEVIFVHALNIK
jgi:hypothetical protein